MDDPPRHSVVATRIRGPHMGSPSLWTLDDHEWASLRRHASEGDGPCTDRDAKPDDAAIIPGIPGLRDIFRDIDDRRPSDAPLPLFSYQRSERQRRLEAADWKAVARPRGPVEVLALGRSAAALPPGPKWAAVAGKDAERRTVPPHPRAPPIVGADSGKENVRPLQLFQLYRGPQPPRSAFKPIPTKPWESKPDSSTAGVPSPSLQLVSRARGAVPPSTGMTDAEPSADTDLGILRVVSFDDEDAGEEYGARPEAASMDQGGGSNDCADDALWRHVVQVTGKSAQPLQQVSPEDDRKNRKCPEPRRLLYVGNTFNAMLEAVAIYDIVPVDGVPVTSTDYAALIGALAEDRRHPNSAERAECVLHHMLSEYKEGRSSVRPDGGMYNKVMHAYADRGDPEKVEGLLRIMCREYDHGDKIAEPNVKHYTTLLHAWQKSSSDEAPVRCEVILAEMHKLDESCGLLHCKPDRYTYTSVLHCWANSDRKDAAVRAEALFRTMKEQFERGDKGMRPDNISYSNLINVFAKSNGFARAEEILWEMVDDYLKGNDSCKPKIRNLNTILAVWSKSTVPYAPERAEDLVRRWQRLTKTTKMDVPPDNYTYCLFLKCWAISTRSDAPDRMMQAMEWMKELAMAGDDAASLDQVKIGTCITSWINSRSFRHAADFLEITCNEYTSDGFATIPDYQYFNKTVRGLCSVNNVSRAEKIIHILWDLKYQERLTSHDTIALVRFVIFEWIRLERADRAEALLIQMDDHHQQGKIREFPDGHTFQLVIGAWKKSRFHDKNDHIEKLQNLQQSRQTTKRRPYFRK